MASRVNMKFVLLLSASLTALAGGVAFIGYKALASNAEKSIAAGDKALAEGDADKAANFYGRAVFKEQRNAEYIKKWISAIEKRKPEIRQVYADAYRDQYMAALQALAEADRRNLEYARRLIDERWEFTTRILGSGLGPLESFVDSWETLMRSFNGDQRAKDILGRYRGLARAGILSANPDLAEDKVEQGMKDLDAAIAADPTDSEAILAAAGMEITRARRLKERRTEEAKAEALEASGMSRLNKLAASDDPLAPRAMFVLHNLKLQASTQNAKSPSEVADAVKASRPQIEAIVSKIMAQKPESTDWQTALQLYRVVVFSGPDGKQLAQRMMEHVAAGHPDQPAFTSQWAFLELQSGNTERAIELARKVAALPDKPLSIEGLQLWTLRPNAIKMQADAAFAAWTVAKDDAERKKWVDEVTRLRADLAARVGEGEPALLAVDGRQAFMKNDLLEARRIITRYNDQTQRQDVQMLVLEGDLLRRAGSFGAARQVFERIMQIDRYNVMAMVSLAEVETAENNFPAAAQLFDAASRLVPENEALKKRAKDLADWVKNDASDPVTKCFREARELSMGVAADIPAAAAKLKACIKDHPGDARLVVALVQLLAGLNEVEEAKRVVNEAVAAKPDNATLKELKRRLDSNDPVALMEETLANQPGLSEAQKNVVRYNMLMRVGRADDARKALAEAVKADAQDAGVLDTQFADAMARRDMAELRRIEQIAVDRNLDRAGGLLYKARREIIEPKLEDAAVTLRTVVEKDKLNQLAWRLLGVVNLDLGRLSEAENALLKAVDIKPDDVQSINAYIRVLANQNKLAEALDFARKSENWGTGDPDFIELLVTLESAAPGGDQSKAILARQRLADRLPKDSPRARANQQMLASLLINAQRFDEAGKIITRLRTEDPKNMTAVELQAGLLGRQGDVPGAVKLYQDAIEALPENERQPLYYINAARLMNQLGDPAAAAAMLEKGRKYQDTQTMLVDREIGDMMFNAGKFDQSIAAYRRVLDAKSEDKGMAVAKRIFEALIRVKNFDEFDKEFNKIPEMERDSTMLLLAAEAAVGQNDRAKARRFYDQAVQADNKNPLVYIKRADFNWDDSKMARDVEADLDQALRVAPNNALVRVRRAKWFSRPGLDGTPARDQLAIQELQQALSSDPSNEQLRLGLAQKFIELGMMRERAQVLDDGVNESQGTIPWRARAAEAWGDIGEWSRAAEHWEAVWQIRKTVDIANYLADSYLNTNSAKDLQSAAMVLSTPPANADQSLPTRMLRARVMHRQGRIADAVAELSSIFNSVNQADGGNVSSFLGGLRTIYPKTTDRLAVLDKLEERGKFKDWMAFAVAGQRITEESAKAKGVSALQGLADSASDPRLKGQAWSLLGSLSFQAGKFEDAQTQFAKGLELDQDNPELNNNLAYILAVKMNKGTEALPYAQKAVQIAPMNSGFRDTLGAAYLATGKLPEAERELRQALELALNDTERAPVFIHLGKTRLAQGEKSDARRLAGAARDLLVADANLRKSYEPDLQELERQIDAR